MNKPKLVISSAYAAILSIVSVIIITIWADLFPPLKDWLKNFSGHHWTTKSILSLMVYGVATALLYRLLPHPDRSRLRGALRLLLVSLGLGMVILTAFYTGHHLKLF